jgi:hypothetical protein
VCRAGVTSVRLPGEGRLTAMRIVFIGYLAVIGFGLAYFLAISWMHR